MPRGEGMMRKPYISRRPDLYLSPVEVLDGAGAAMGGAVVELSTRPFVDLVWVGALLALLGAVIAGVRRAVEVRPAPLRESRQPV